MNKNFFIKQVRYFLSMSLIFLLLSACTVENAIEDVIEENIKDGNDFTAKVNGTNFNAAKGGVFMEVQEGPSFYYIIIAAIDTKGSSKADAILLAMIGADFNEFDSGKIFEHTFEENVNNIIDGAGARYSNDWDSDDSDFDKEYIESVYIKITALDRDKKLISGEFNFVSIDPDSGNKYTVSDGKFTNILYKIKTN